MTSTVEGRAGTMPGRLSHEEVVARAESLVDGVRARARDAEQLRRLPEETMAEVEAADLLRTMVPTRYGGHGLGLRTVCELTRALARGCPSTAWVVGFLVEHNWQFARFPLEVQEEIFGAQPYIKAPAQLQPSAVMTPVEGGWRATGRWAFCSAVMHGDWAILAGVEAGDEPGGDRRSALVFIVPMSEVTVVDDWHTAGMRATGSATIVVEDLFVPTHRATPFAGFASEDNPGAAIHPEPIVRYPLGASLTVFAASVAVGAAEETVELFRQQMSQRVLWATAGVKPADKPKSQARLAEATLQARTAELLWRDALDLLCDVNDGGGKLTMPQRAWVRLASTKAGLAARDAISTVCEGAGAKAYYDDSPIQRFQRDIETMKGHVVFDIDRASVQYGRVALGLDPDDLI
jgi:alkylation response protein AidB-like acyl-CoA dehydrogenase